MINATMMMATLAFFQPFKHAEVLSINAFGNLAVLMVLFAAMFLVLNGSGSELVALVLVLCTLAPLAACVALTLRLPESSLGGEAGSALVDDLSTSFSSLLHRFRSSKGKKASAERGAGGKFDALNPMHKGNGKYLGNETDTTGHLSQLPRPSDLVKQEKSDTVPTSMI